MKTDEELIKEWKDWAAAPVSEELIQLFKTRWNAAIDCRPHRSQFGTSEERKGYIFRITKDKKFTSPWPYSLWAYVQIPDSPLAAVWGDKYQNETAFRSEMEKWIIPTLDETPHGRIYEAKQDVAPTPVSEN